MIKSQKILTAVFMALTSFGTASAGEFVNGGFESGTFSGWTQGGGYWEDPLWYNMSGTFFSAGSIANTVITYPLPLNPLDPKFVGSGLANNLIMDKRITPYDTYLLNLDPSLQLSTVYNGNYSVRVNDSTNNFGVSTISQTVANYNHSYINLAWSAVLQSSHGATDSDHFVVQVKDGSGAVVFSTSYSSATSAGVFTEVLSNGNASGIAYSGWRRERIAVTSGGTYTVSLLAADCPYGGHFGYAYLDSFSDIALPSTLDTNASLQLPAYQLRSAYNSQVAASNLSLTHDCNLFDVKGLCISAGGRYTAIDNPTTNASAAVVTLGYKMNSNIRIGGFMDQNINIHTPGSINVANKNPLMGLYAVWNKEASGLGYQVRLANTYQDKDVTTTRVAYGASGEAGSGTATLNSQSYLAELSYAFQYQDKTLVRPYFGLRYTRLKRDGYSEGTTDTVTAPLAFDALSDRSASALLGARLNYQATPKTSFTASLGLEQDVYHKVGNLSATNSVIGDLNPVAFNSNIKRTRPVVSAGAYYDVTKAQRLSGTVTYQQLPFQATGATSIYVNYMIGF